MRKWVDGCVLWRDVMCNMGFGGYNKWLKYSAVQ
jgi:hypothetical protein